MEKLVEVSGFAENRGRGRGRADSRFIENVIGDIPKGYVDADERAGLLLMRVDLSPGGFPGVDREFRLW